VNQHVGYRPLPVQPIAWKGDHLEILDQTALPGTVRYLKLTRMDEVYEAIRRLQVRGAPLIGITAAYGLYLGLRDLPLAGPKDFFARLDEKIAFLACARPTAVNLLWALQGVRRKLLDLSLSDPENLKDKLFDFAAAIHEDGRLRCERIADFGQTLVPAGARILTHCHTGILATGGLGTALGIIHRAHQLGKGIEVFADETRPLLQGARLTLWELSAAGIRARLICDNMPAALMRRGGVDLVLVGADRVAADGSVANKIGTYALAIAAQYHRVPFYVAAPLSTVDPTIARGEDIPIEMRGEDEVRRVLDQTLVTVPDAPCWNPAFDVTPPELTHALVTDAGIVHPPFQQNLAALCRSNPGL
jgi:methylthioribose-1-phosphate isomerase